MEAASAGTWSWHPVSGLFTVSPHLARLLGYSKQTHTLSRAQCLRLIHRADRAAVEHQPGLDNLPAPTSTGTVVREIRVRAARGGCQWLYVRAQWRYEAPGEGVLDGVAVAIQELRTAQQDRERLFAQLQEQEQRAQITLRSIADGVIATDGAGAITRLNAAAERLTGWPQQEALGRQASEVLNVRAAAGDASAAAATDQGKAALICTGCRGWANRSATASCGCMPSPSARSGGPARACITRCCCASARRPTTPSSRGCSCPPPSATT